MKKIAICDDDTNIVNYIKNNCISYFEHNNEDVYIDCYKSGEDLLKEKNIYDYLFLDIEIGTKNGIEVAKLLRQYSKKTLIIIISGHQKYKAQAYSIHAFDYLDKPLSKTDIFSTLKEAESYKANINTYNLIPFKTISGDIFLDVDDIIYLEYINRKICIHTLNRNYEFYGKFKDSITNLTPYGFYSPHRAYLINFKYLKKIIGNNQAILLNNDSIPISKLRINEFRKEFLNYLKNFSNTGVRKNADN